MRISAIYLPIALAACLVAQTQLRAPSPGSPVEPPTLEHIGAVAPDILAIEIQAGRVLPMREVPYRKEASDQVTEGKNAQTGEVLEMRVLRVREAQKAMNRAAQKVGMIRITHHDLRHLFATVCIESGVDIPTVSRWLGHLDGGVLAMKTYGHLRDEHSRQSALKVSFRVASEVGDGKLVQFAEPVAA